jgi:hypothetical protein
MSAMLFALVHAGAHADSVPESVRETVRVVHDDSGWRLQVDGRAFFVRGMNWDYIPIGQNYAYDLFQQPEDVIIAALDREMTLLAGLGVNAIRVYSGIPPRWVRYIHDRYGIYCIINHTVGRYGYSLDGVWRASVDYSAPRMRAALAADVASMVNTYKDCAGVLMYLLGNENNYGLSWSSFEIEALPKGERDAARAKHLYSLFGEIARATKAADPGVPVAIANGDVQYIDLIATECKGLDIFGTNVYRGISSRDLFQVVRDKLGLPMMYTEFGSDAFNARELREDQATQARYLIGQWREIYEKSAGHGQEGNAIGGCVFQWSDGWWKHMQEERLDVHDTNASWPNGGYTEDYVQGENNMNEEWWGICAKSPPDSRGLYDLFPRAAYFALRRVFALDPYAATTTNDVIRAHFATITPSGAVLEARGEHAALVTSALERVRVSGLRLDFETINTGTHYTREPQPGDPPFAGFDRLQSFYVDFEGRPSPAAWGRLSLNARGHVPQNPIDQIFYENRSPDRMKVYQAEMGWEERWFALAGFYRTGHFHWGYEGDFFGLYREANYGPNIDTYDAEAPIGVEIAAKRRLSGLKVAFGPQVWWGAPPATLWKYRRQFGRVDATAMYEHDLNAGTEQVVTIVGSTPVVLRPTKKATLQLKTTRGPTTIELGGIWAGSNYEGQAFPVEGTINGEYALLSDKVKPSDEFGGKVRLSGSRGRLQWYAQGAAMGLVADAGPTAVNNYMGWNLKDTGLGNQQNLIGGFVHGLGRFQIGPNFLWQKPIVGPLPRDPRNNGVQRNVLDHPFAVRANREMAGAELLVSLDPTPGTWLFAWDNDVREDARLAGTVSFIYKHMPTTMDPAVGIAADGVTTFVFDGATPPRDLWEVSGRAVSRLNPRLRLVAHVYTGVAEPNLAPDPRLVRRTGFDFKLAGTSNWVAGYVKWNDYGPYDFYRDYNLTYPLQLMGEVAHTLGLPMWFDTDPQTEIGVRGLWRSLDEFSLRYGGNYGDPLGSEWEIRTYVRLAI